jgi:predicted GIY-YIG superfamily endonuclease
MHSGDRRCYCVYILTNRCKTLYVGVTNNLRQRVWEHKFGDGSEFANATGLISLFTTRVLMMCAVRLIARSGSRDG